MRNPLKARIAARKASLGLLVTIPSVPVVQVLARSGFDCLLIDLEHAPMDMPSVHALIAATAGTSAAPLVRVPWNLAWLAKPALDVGAAGIAFPMVNSRSEAEAAVAAVRYPPAGRRNWGPFYAPFRWDVSMQQYMKRADDEVLALVAVEHPDAVARAEEIVTTPGVDLAVIGSGDLATSLGHPAEVDHPDVRAAIARAEAAVLASGVPLGGVAFSPQQANDLIERGYLLVFLGFDWALLRRGAAAALDGIRREP